MQHLKNNVIVPNLHKKKRFVLLKGRLHSDTMTVDSSMATHTNISVRNLPAIIEEMYLVGYFVALLDRPKCHMEWIYATVIG